MKTGGEKFRAGASKPDAPRTRIAFVSDQAAPHYIGGYETRLWELARRLSASGSDVTIFTSCDREEMIEGVRFVSVRKSVNYFPDKKRGFRDLRQNAIFAVCLLKLLPRSDRFDIVDANSIPWIHLPFAFLLARRWRARFVVSAHEAFSFAMPTYFEKKSGAIGKIVARLAIQFYKASQGLAEALIATSPSCVEGLREEGFRAPIYVVPSGEDVLDDNDIDDSTELTIAFSGRLVQMKRIHVLLDAAFELGNPLVNIIGDGPLRAELEEKAIALGLSRTVFHGRVSDARKIELLKASNLFVMPSYREGWSLSTLESMANGCFPIYGYRPDRYETGIRSYTADGLSALSFDGTASDLASKVILARQSLRSRRIQSLSAARVYSWPEMLKRAEEAYDEIVKLK
jgi:glycosyltransferase involved in cell wall biosynthesis